MTFCAEVAANGMLRRVLLVLCEFAEPNSNGKRLDGQSPNVQYPGNFGALCEKRIRIEDGVVQMTTKEQQALRLMPRAHNSRPRFFRKPKKIELHTLSRHVLEPFYQVFPTSLRILLQLLPLNHTSLSWFYDGDENTRLACLSKRFSILPSSLQPLAYEQTKHLHLHRQGPRTSCKSRVIDFATQVSFPVHIWIAKLWKVFSLRSSCILGS